jgi:hypothetical protein
MSKRKDADAVAWLESHLATLDGFSPNQIEVARQVLTSEPFSMRVREGLLGRSEISRLYNEISEVQKELDDKRLELVAHEEALETWRGDLEVWREAKIEEFQSITDALEQRTTDDPSDDTNDDLDIEGDIEMARDYMTREEFERLWQEREQRLTQGVQGGFAGMVGLQKFLAKANAKHTKEYGEPLDIDEFEKHFTEGSYSSYDKAFEDYLRPREEQKKEQEFQKKLEEARLEGRREAHSNSQYPGRPGASARNSPLFRRPGAKEDEGTPLTEDEKVARFEKLFMNELERPDVVEGD